LPTLLRVTYSGTKLSLDGSAVEWAYSRNNKMHILATALEAPAGMVITLQNIDSSNTFNTGLNQIADILAYLATLPPGNGRGVGDLYFATKDGSNLKCVNLVLEHYFLRA
jgi:hypothetical protein